MDADVSGYFDSIDHGLLREAIRKRVADKNMIRLIGKWLNAGVLEEENIYYPQNGTPQGGVISPMLGNIFLHYVLDDWFVKDVRPRMKGRCFLIRFADDFVIGFEREDDARKVMDVIPKRFNRFKLTIHPEKTKLIKFGRPVIRNGVMSENDTFDFLGFTHYWTKSLQDYWVIKRKTIKKRLRRAMNAFWEWCRRNLHEPIWYQYQKLSLKLKGYYGYYGIRGNSRMLEVVYKHVIRAWHYWLNRRSSTGYICWEKFNQFLAKWTLPRPRIVHNI